MPAPSPLASEAEIRVKELRTFHRALFVYSLLASAVLFLFTIGAAQELLTWNASVFASSVIMMCYMAFYCRGTLHTAFKISREKDAFDCVHAWLERQYKNALEAGDSPFPAALRLVCSPRDVLAEIGKPQYGATHVVEYFSQLGRRIEIVREHRRHHETERSASADSKIDELLYIFEMNIDRAIQPMVNAGTKLLLLGFLGTVVGIIMIGIGMRFGGTAQESLKIAVAIIAGVGVAATTTAFGIIGRYFLGAFYEQHEDVRNRLTTELLRLTNAYGLDLMVCASPEERSREKTAEETVIEPKPADDAPGDGSQAREI